MAFVAYVLSVFGLLLGLTAPAAYAQQPDASVEASAGVEDPAEAGPTPPDWVVTCAPGTDPTKTTCQMAQSLVVEETGKLLVSVVIRPQTEDRRMGMLLTLPHGLYFPPGLSIRVDQGEATDVAIQTSDQNGVYAALPLTDELVTAMKLGRSLNIAMQFADGREEVVPLTLEGFTAAMEKLTSLL